MRALIHAGQVVQIEEKDFPVAEGLFWVDCPNGASLDTHFFNGAEVVVKPPKSAEEIAAEEKAAALVELEKIDLASIRALREYVAALPDAPQWLKDREAQAQAARAKLGGKK